MSSSFTHTSHVIIAGYGVPGHAVAEQLDRMGIEYCVLELNAATVRRCAKSGVHIVEGDVREAQVLQRAGIEQARALIIAIPDEKAALEATRVARSLNRDVKIMSRTHYVSAGMEARQRGADAVVIAEQVVAAEMSHQLRSMLGEIGS